jgi:dienelactone hydrolase
MTIKVKCDHCGAGFAVPDEWAGKKGRCPKCSGVIQVPVVDDLPVLDSAPVPRPAPRPAPAARRPSPATVQPAAPTPQPVGGGAGQSSPWLDELPAPMASLPPPSWQTPAPAPKAVIGAALSTAGKSLGMTMLDKWLASLVFIAVAAFSLTLLSRGQVIAAVATACIGAPLGWLCSMSSKKQRAVLRIDWLESNTGVALGFLLVVIVLGIPLILLVAYLDSSRYLTPVLGTMVIIVGLAIASFKLIILFWIISKFSSLIGHGVALAGLFLLFVWGYTAFSAPGVPCPYLSGSATDLLPLAEAPVPEFRRTPVFASVGKGIKGARVVVGVGAGQPGRCDNLHLYLPEGNHPVHSLPCVFIAPAGATPLSGMEIGEADTAEFLPYVSAGFAVVAYEIDRPFDQSDGFSFARMHDACRQFAASMAGMVNARNALEYVLAMVPEVDPAQLYAAGHSSAGTAALLFAAHEPRLKGCLAYAPRTDCDELLNDPAIRVFEWQVPGVTDFLVRASPITHVKEIRCPVFLYHTETDAVVNIRQTRRFAAKLPTIQVNFVEARMGGHSDTILDEAIPLGIEWLSARTTVPSTVQRMVAERAPAKHTAVDHDELVRKWDEESRQRMEESRRQREEQNRRHERRIEDELPKPDDPERLERLAELMMIDDSVGEAAIDQILKIDPATATAEVRTLVTQNFRSLVETGRSSRRTKSIRGLAKWGGKQSVPMLIGLLEQRGNFADQEILRIMGDYPDPVAAAAVAKLLNDHFRDGAARDCLRRMGPVAEDALIATVPIDDAQACLAAVQLLGDVGTEKSLKVLRKAIFESRNPQVKAAAKTAVRRITDRQNGTTSDDAP